MRNLQRDASVAVDISPLIRLIDQRPPRTTTMSAFKPLQTRALPCRMTHDQISDLIPEQSRDGRGGRAPGGVRRCACDHRGGEGGRRVRVRRWHQRGVDPVLVAGDGSVSPQTYPGSELDGAFAVLEVPRAQRTSSGRARSQPHADARRNCASSCTIPEARLALMPL